MCTEILSDFSKPYKYGNKPCMVTRINYRTEDVENVPLRNPKDYIQMLDCPSLHLEWFNRKGGWNNFQFTGKHSHGQSIMDGIIYENELGEELYSSRGKIRDTVDVVSQYISRSDKTALMHLVHSISVYWLTEGLKIPVIIEQGEYFKFKERGELIWLEFRMRVSKLIKVQTA